ncbi:response regulator [Psychromarinibacter halotolerans]|uniref:histidine kinase n=1 Tax=Psychromarinibacter halotolerans TaxID=1775175 RepID=A0ABV7GVU7_9RHOB|nr:response regulator [Psychromarinibacter halotolerans]MDF0597597.1 response regulator [Psychromarinibacter halotolerans]
MTVPPDADGDAAAVPGQRVPRIALRIGGLSAILLGVLVLSTVVMAFEFSANQKRIAEATERFHRLQVATAANRDFGMVRYWLADLAVSQLTLSERNAEAARDQLNTRITALEDFAPEAAATIRSSTDTIWTTAIAAVDAYADGNRVVGNALMSQARTQSDAVTLAMAALVDDLSEQSIRANDTAASAAQDARFRALIICLVIVLAGALLTALVLRSILQPLNRIDAAMADLQAGRAPVDLPPEGPDEFGRLSTTLRTLWDTQRARAELEEINAQQRRTVLTAVETIPDGFALFDETDRMVLRNERFLEIFPFARALPETATYAEFLDAEIASGILNIPVEEADAWRADCLARHANPGGSRAELPYGPHYLLVSKGKTPDGGTVAVYSDISELRDRQVELEAARAEAEEANDAKSRFLASMSHELRTPLNAIIGYSEMLIEDAEDAGDTTSVPDLQRIESSGRHLLALINDILDLSKIEAGKMEMHIEEVDIATLVDDVQATVAPLVAMNDNTLSVTVADDIGTMMTDRTKLRQNLFNLLSNASKFTQNGRVDLTVTPEAEMIRFDVRDEGIGMTPDQLSRLFQPFAQADSSTSSKYGGTGLGLSIVKSYCEMLGGGVSVVSEPGKGSTFTIRLPVSARAPAPADGTPTVLIIDDDETALDSLGRTVRDAGYAVLTATDAATGLALARERRPDAVLLDIIMPERDGWSVLRDLKEDPILCETPVIMVSILTDREMGLAFGAVEQLMKPVDPDRLIAALEALAGDADREILLVDDDPATRGLFRRILSREGWSVREAADGARALALVEERRPSLLVMDLMMPNLDGFQTLKRLRETEAGRGLPVIIVTSKDLTRREFDWLQDNARDVVMKGGDGRADLLAAIARQVGSASATANEEAP